MQWELGRNPPIGQRWEVDIAPTPGLHTFTARVEFRDGTIREASKDIEFGSRIEFGVALGTGGRTIQQKVSDLFHIQKLRS